MKDYKLPKEFAEKWISALRSRKYTQAKGTLQDKDSYCCLGVACVISGINDKLYDKIHIPKEFVEKYHIPEEITIRKELSAILAGMNDEGKSFYQIADWIEENVEFY